MKKNVKAFFLTLFFLMLTCLLLTFPGESLALSLTGLQLWFNQMIPALLPFMILSGMMIRLNLTGHFVRLLNPLLGPLLCISPNGIYAVVIGFLCGFPMGAKVIADLYAAHRLSREEASFLLSFCNNIGPVYFVGFALPTLGLEKKLPYLFGMYGVPLLYGLLLRHTLYRDTLPCRPVHTPPARSIRHVLTAAETPVSLSLLDALDDSILSGLYSIARLGGYMVLFNLLNLLPQILFRQIRISGIRPGVCSGFFSNVSSGAVIGCLLEITSGISRIGSSAPLLVLLLLPFGGFSCIAQTHSMIKNTDLSLKSYVLHKAVLTLLTVLYYGIWYFCSSSSFLL